MTFRVVANAKRAQSHGFVERAVAASFCTIQKFNVAFTAPYATARTLVPITYAKQEKPMNIAALSSHSPAVQMTRTKEASEGPGPDHDGDADDKAAPVATATSTAQPAGMGASVDVKT